MVWGFTCVATLHVEFLEMFFKWPKLQTKHWNGLRTKNLEVATVIFEGKNFPEKFFQLPLQDLTVVGPLQAHCRSVDSRNWRKGPFNLKTSFQAKQPPREHARTPKAIFWRTSWSQHCRGPQKTSKTLLEAKHAQRKRWSKLRSLTTFIFSTCLSTPSDQGRSCSRTPEKYMRVRHQAKAHRRLVVKFRQRLTSPHS